MICTKQEHTVGSTAAKSMLKIRLFGKGAGSGLFCDLIWATKDGTGWQY